MKIDHRIAAERIPYGSPLRAEGEGCAISTKLTDMIGVARRGGPGRDAWEAGEKVAFTIDGGARTELATDATLVIGGVERRLLRFEPNYFVIREGKIVG